jgi:nitroimidazol reductase NimA-like FMN-containing flavoprotein (pyridoxamine 5'-phosphate oxidase superfamily)
VGVVMAEAIGVLIQEMTTRECWRMLARSNIFRLACARDNQPYIVPLRVDLDGEFLYGYATLGRKIEWMRTNPLVCLEFEELTTDREWASVIVFGHYEELPPVAQSEDARRVADRLFQRQSRIRDVVRARWRESFVTRRDTNGSRQTRPNSVNPAALPSTTQVIPALPP